jgi:hypothetical protein
MVEEAAENMGEALEVFPVNKTYSLIDSIDLDAVASTMQKINTMQTVIRQTLKDGHDYGLIPGVQKPVMLKPGAEKICMIFGLNPEYDFLSNTEDYKAEFFSYTIRCTLFKRGEPCSQGIGSCNSKEKKYRYVNVDSLPNGYVGHSELITDRYGRTRYKIENNDACSLVNTILKMAKKRALVDAVLQVGSLSEIFTQGAEDAQDFNRLEQSAAAGSMDVKQSAAIKCNFGKYKGSPLGEIYKMDKDYFDWLANNAKDAPIKSACETIQRGVKKHQSNKAVGNKPNDLPAPIEAMPPENEVSENDIQIEPAANATSETVPDSIRDEYGENDEDPELPF